MTYICLAIASCSVACLPIILRGLSEVFPCAQCLIFILRVVGMNENPLLRGLWKWPFQSNVKSSCVRANLYRRWSNLLAAVQLLIVNLLRPGTSRPTNSATTSNRLCVRCASEGARDPGSCMSVHPSKVAFQSPQYVQECSPQR